MAKSTDPKTWASFEEAAAAVGRWCCDGVGFVFGPDRAFTGLDLDHVMANGVLDAEYRWVVDEAGTYTEVSPSGDGLHLIFRGPKPEGAERSRKGQPGGRVVEMYDHDRYFTVTGDVFEGRGALGSNPEAVERRTAPGSSRSGPPRSRRSRRRPRPARTWTTRPCWGACTPPAEATRSAPSWPATARRRAAIIPPPTWRSAATWPSGARATPRA